MQSRAYSSDDSDLSDLLRFTQACCQQVAPAAWDHYDFWQVDWENPVGVVASVSIIGAFRFLGEGKFCGPNLRSPVRPPRVGRLLG